MIKYIFDVDGVLCDTGQPIDKEFEDYFEWWTTDKEYYFITGSHREKTIDQIGSPLVDNQHIGFHCLGNAIYPPGGNEVLINDFEFTEDEMEHFHSFWASSKYDQKPEFKTVLEKRQGSYNFSLAPRSGDRELRNYYMQHDRLYKERENFIIQLNYTFPRLEAYKGGSVSVDICLRGANKGQMLDLIDDNKAEIVFFCDQYDQYGIDTPLVKKIDALPEKRGTTYKINKGYKETWEILKTL